MQKVILFDLDSTLLQMNQDLFLKHYFKGIATFAAKLGYNPHEFMEEFQKGAYAILKNKGTITNEEAFWNVIENKYHEVDFLKAKFDEFYQTDFKAIEEIVDKSDIPNKIIKTLKSKGYIIILATNPLFPRICTLERIRWAGMDYKDFDDITTYEDSHYCKPNHLYYEEILKRNNLSKEGCIMVGNDIDDDFSDLPCDIKPIIITDYLINKNNKEINMDFYKLEEFYNEIKKNY